MMIRSCVCFCLSAALLLAGRSAFAEEFYWNNAAGGSWDDPANWASKSGTATDYPGYDSVWDTIGKRKVNAPFTITLRKDEQCYTANVSELNNGTGYQTFDLGGHFLRISGQLYFAGCGGSAGHNILPARGMEFKNGTVSITTSGFGLGYYNQNNPGTIIFSDCVVTGHCYIANGQSTITVRDGSTWVVTKDTVFPTEGSTPMSVRNAYIAVTGETSSVQAPLYNLKLRHISTGYFLFDGTSACYTNVLVGDTERSTNVVMGIRNALLTVGDTLALGSGLAGGTGSKLSVSGTTSCITAGTLKLYDGQGVVLDVTVPKDGFGMSAASEPLFKLEALDIVAREAELPNSGDLSLALTCYEWVKAHPETTIPLVRLATADAVALQALADAVHWSDVPSALVEQGKGPTLAVSDDGTTLNLVSPAVNYKPSIEVTIEPGTATGTKVVKIHVFDYGFDATGITALNCEYADNPDFTDSVTTNLLQGLPPLSTAVPFDVSYVLAGGFVQYKGYYVRVTAVNEAGKSSDGQMKDFVGDAVAETLKWGSAATEGVWQDADNWAFADGSPAQTYPRGEDVISTIGSSGTRSVSLTEDAAFDRYSTALTAGRLTFQMNGHALTANDVRTTSDPNVFAINSGGTAKEDLETVGAVLEFRNGTFYATNRFYGTVYTGLMLGYCQASSHGTLVLDDHAVLNAAIKYMNNSSRIFVKGGSVLNELGRDLIMQGHTARNPNPLLCVTGENSRVSFPDYTIRIRGFGGACYVQQGALLEAKTLDIGGTNFCSGIGTDGVTGQIYSTNTHVHVENATLAVKQNLTIGWSNDAQCAPRLIMNGTGTTVRVGGTLKIHGGLAAALEYELPVGGFASDPLTANALELVARPSGNTDYGATQIKLRGLKAWAKANPEASVNLLKLTEPNADGLAALKASAVLDWDKLTSDCLSVSADGTALILTAPPRPGLLMFVQ